MHLKNEYESGSIDTNVFLLINKQFKTLCGTQKTTVQISRQEGFLY